MKYVFNESLIQQLRDGKIAVENTGNIDIITVVLDKAFGKSTVGYLGVGKYYWNTGGAHIY